MLKCERGFAGSLCIGFFARMGKVLPVLVSEADKCGRGFVIFSYELRFTNLGEVSSGRDFAILFMKLASRGCGRDFASLSMR